jgi:hypothetical protein
MTLTEERKRQIERCECVEKMIDQVVASCLLVGDAEMCDIR